MTLHNLQMFSRPPMLPGMVPVKKLLYNPIAFICVSKPISDGIVPMRAQSFKNRCVKWLKAERLDGIVPLK